MQKSYILLLPSEMDSALLESLYYQVSKHKHRSGEAERRASQQFLATTTLRS